MFRTFASVAIVNARLVLRVRPCLFTCCRGAESCGARYATGCAFLLLWHRCFCCSWDASRITGDHAEWPAHAWSLLLLHCPTVFVLVTQAPLPFAVSDVRVASVTGHKERASGINVGGKNSLFSWPGVLGGGCLSTKAGFLFLESLLKNVAHVEQHNKTESLSGR